MATYAERIKYYRDYYQAHKEKIRLQNNASYHKNSVSRLVTHKRYRERNKIEWLKVLKSKGFDKCSHCGYDKCFAAIDFHHIQKKEFYISKQLWLPVSARRLKELEKTIPLCRNCHMELHHG